MKVTKQNSRHRRAKKMVLSLEARLFLVEQVSGNSGEYTEAVQRKFAEKFPGNPIPHRNTVRQLIAKVRDTGSVADAPRSGRPPVLTEEKIRDISNRKLQSPTNSIRKLSQQTGVSSSTAHRALKLSSHSHLHTMPSIQKLKKKTVTASRIKLKKGDRVSKEVSQPSQRESK